MPKFTIEQPHALPLAEAKTRLESFLSRMASKMGGTYAWSSDTDAAIKHSLATAAVKIEAQKVKVDVDGGMALSLVRAKIEGKIREALADALAGKGGGSPVA